MRRSFLPWLAVACGFVASWSAAVGDAPAPGDIVMNLHSTANGMPAVVFPHWVHRQQFRCYACHPKPFEMRGGANTITMAALRSGEQCGVCHNGHIAFEVGFNTCRVCHSREEP